MNIFLTGATGNAGRAILAAALAADHDVTAIVRDPKRVPEQGKLTVIAGDLTKRAALQDQMNGHDVVINAAGNVHDEYGFCTMFDGIMTAAEGALGEDGRFWFFGGAAALDIPGSPLRGVHLPVTPKVYRQHIVNLRRAQISPLNWSMLCPGQMNGGPAHKSMRVSRNIWPIDRPSYTKVAGILTLSAAFARGQGEMVVSYADAAQVILHNLNADSRYARARVGLALPKGERGSKDDA